MNNHFKSIAWIKAIMMHDAYGFNTDTTELYVTLDRTLFDFLCI